MKKLLIVFWGSLILSLISFSAFAQKEGKRGDTHQVNDIAFWPPILVTQATTHQLNSSALNVSVMSSFGIATDDPLKNFFGLNQIRNVRIGIDYGITDWWSLGLGRSSLLNVIDGRAKFALLRQNLRGSAPVSISLKSGIAVVTQKNSRPFLDDISISASIIISRKFNNILSLQLTPMFTHNNGNFFVAALGATIRLNKRFALMAEYYPIFGDRSPKTVNPFSFGLNIKAGRQVIQLFFASTYWHIPDFIIAKNDNNFFAGDFRFGFNINRVFEL